MTRILFLTNTYTNGGGAEAVLSDLVCRLDKSKYQITIQEETCHRVKLPKTPSEVHIKKRPMRDTRLPLSLFNKLNRCLEEIAPDVIANIFSLNEYDIVIAWCMTEPVLLLNGIKSTGKVVWLHVDFYNVRNYVLDCAFKKTNKVVCISNKTLASFISAYPEYQDKTILINNMCDVQKLSGASTESVTLAGGCGMNIICIGAINKRKNFALVIDAVKVLCDEESEVHLHILGEGNERANLESKVKSLGLEGQVHFYGYVQNPMPYIKACDVLCISSLREGLPTVAMEAMSLGRPFVTTPVAGASEELSMGGKCGLVSGYDAKEYAAKLKLLLTDGELYKSMSEACIKHIADYTPEETLKKFDGLIESLPRKDCGGKGKKGISRLKYMLYSVCDAAHIYHAISYIRKIKGGGYTKYHLPKAALYAMALCYMACASILSVILLPIRIVSTLIYLFTLRA